MLRCFLWAASLALAAQSFEQARTWLERAETCWKQNDRAGAELAAQKAETLGAKDPVVRHGLSAYYFEVGKSYLDTQQFEPAIRVIEHGLRLADDKVQLELALGVAYYGQRRFADATTAFLRTIDLAPEVKQPYLFLGRMLDNAGDRLPDITRRFEKHAGANPHDPLALFLYAKSLIASGGDLGKAERLLRASVALKGDQWDSHYELGLLLEKQRRFEEASAELERAVAIEPGRPEAHYHLARVYDQAGRTDKAAEQRGIHDKMVRGSQL